MALHNPLDVLFKEIKREIYLEELAEARKPRLPPPPHQSTYANPQNWTLGAVIRLVHREDGPLGNFQEYFHKLSKTARRLLPAAQGLEPQRDELVWGEFWLHPKFQAQPEPESEREIREIIARFNELMDDLEEDL